MASRVGGHTVIQNKSKLTPVVADTMKGSYYANPVLDEPNVSAELRQGYPEYYGKNICKASLRHII